MIQQIAVADYCCAVYVGNRAMPTLINSYRNIIEVQQYMDACYEIEVCLLAQNQQELHFPSQGVKLL